MSNITQADVQSAENVCCEECKNETFKQTFVIKRISALVSQDGRETYVPIPLFTCFECGHTNSLFVKDLKINEKRYATDSEE